ncbi:hypothetical protein [Bradyrhizobium erythrophlei]|uniref:Uncharacterized protein n=1 Tax=Bradyrhizobium erythrophlei TaxID=1437360 RepID=A0A1M5ND66_9BRAD|nr:hypothetical protein [Bradyrhizobium erythrophlei]SHG87129.1 hypothetical protein SAMN05443248_2931 [Bradyrhizobium erythrophlei]
MSSLILPRRSVLKVLAGLIAAPAIARASSLMPVKVMEPLPEPLFKFTSRYPGIVPLRHDINFGPTTLNGLPVYHQDGRPVSSGELVSGHFCRIKLDGDRWVLV